MIAEGRSINVTLIFSLTRYAEVIEAYLSGLEALAASGVEDLSGVASVASFFISRVDTEVDRRIEAAAGGLPDPRPARTAGHGGRGPGPAGLRAVHRPVLRARGGKRWRPEGARVQRPLWASTSTKNPAYPDLAYVDTLIGPDTVNTMPDGTVADFLDHGTVARTVDTDPDGARSVIDRLAAAGIDMEDVAGRARDRRGRLLCGLLRRPHDLTHHEGGRTHQRRLSRPAAPSPAPRRHQPTNQEEHP